MHWSVKIVAVGGLWAGSVWACCQALGQTLAPGDGARIPANTPFFVDQEPWDGRTTVVDQNGTHVELHGELDRTSRDGRVTRLQPLESGERGSRFYETGRLQAGEVFFLSDAGVRVEVTPDAELPTVTGVLTFGPEFTGNRWCDFFSPPRMLIRDVFLQRAQETDPWRDVGRVRFAQRAFDQGAVFVEPGGAHFGSLADDVPGLGMPVGRVVVDCDASPGRHAFELEAAFEVAGAPPAEPARQHVVMDCAARPPVGCSHAPSLLSVLAAVLFWRGSKRGAASRPDDAAPVGVTGRTST